VVDACAVQHQHGPTGSVLHVVDQHLARSGLHPLSQPRTVLPALAAALDRGDAAA
jgi:hypothetical protein